MTICFGPMNHNQKLESDSKGFYDPGKSESDFTIYKVRVMLRPDNNIPRTDA